jgi:hypothetical protein
LTINREEPISPDRALMILKTLQHPSKQTPFYILLAKRTDPTKTTLLESYRSVFHQIHYIYDDPRLTAPTPRVNKIIQDPSFPSTPSHIVQLGKLPYRAEWTDAIMENYDKMWDTGAWSKPSLRTELPKDIRILRPRQVFKLKRTELTDTYDLTSRCTADGSKQVYGSDYDNTYAPVATITSIRICIALEAAFQWSVHSIDVCNAYANNIIKPPHKQPIISLPY